MMENMPGAIGPYGRNCGDNPYEKCDAFPSIHIKLPAWFDGERRIRNFQTEVCIISPETLSSGRLDFGYH
jgi:hypothetical protein